MRIVRFRPQHLRALALQGEQSDLRQVLEQPEYGHGLALAGDAYTVLDGETVLGCLGVQEHHAGRAECWALLADGLGWRMKPLTRAAAGWLAQAPYARIEAHIATDFHSGHRWARLLGFVPEGPERLLFFPDGRSAVTYVRLDHGIHRGSAPLHRGSSVGSGSGAPG